ncbi:hypothetical protein [Desulfocastanea catecholica]
MKPFSLFFSVLLFGLVACAAETQLRLPQLIGAAEGLGENGCAAVFPQENRQFVHAIDFTMQDGSGTAVVGVTSLNDDDIACALVTVEGLTLFEAVFRHGRSFQVKRAVPPFDKPAFAQGMIGDIRAIFQPPPGRGSRGQVLLPAPAAGLTAVCRYEDPAGGVVDVLPDVDGCWQIRSYTPDGTMNRAIVGRSCRVQGTGLIPDLIELKTYGRTGYTLKMTLIRADTIL